MIVVLRLNSFQLAHVIFAFDKIRAHMPAAATAASTKERSFFISLTPQNIFSMNPTIHFLQLEKYQVLSFGHILSQHLFDTGEKYPHNP